MTRQGATAMLLMLVGLVVAGCQSMRYVDLYPPGAVPSRAQQQLPRGDYEPGWQSFYFLGLSEPRKIDAHTPCGENGVAEIRTGRTAGQAFITGLSAGIFYMPFTGQVVCVSQAPEKPPAKK